MLPNTRFLFVLLFCEYLQIDYSMARMPPDLVRRVVHFAVEKDPCKSLDGWDFMIDDPDEETTGEGMCGEVMAMFRTLDDNEKKGCPNAGEAHCSCHGFLREPRCTFMCDIESVDRNAPPVKRSRGTPLEYQRRTERKARILPIIAAHVYNPTNPTPLERPRSPPENQLQGSRLGPFRVDGTSKSAGSSRKRNKSPSP